MSSDQAKEKQGEWLWKKWRSQCRGSITKGQQDTKQHLLEELGINRSVGQSASSCLWPSLRLEVLIACSEMLKAEAGGYLLERYIVSLN